MTDDAHAAITEPTAAPRGTRDKLGLGARATTINPWRSRKSDREEVRRWLPIWQDEVAPMRPRTRADCAGVQRPCPFVACSYNNYLDVDPATGSLKINFPDRDPDEVDPHRSCALDLVDAGGATLEDVAGALNVTRERVRQIESRALAKVRGVRGRPLRDYAPEDGGGECVRPSESSRRFARARDAAADDSSGDAPDRPLMSAGDSASFFSTGDVVDELVCARVWRVYLRESGGGAPADADATSAMRRSTSASMPADVASARLRHPAPAPVSDAAPKPNRAIIREMASKKKYDQIQARRQRVHAFYHDYEKREGEPPSQDAIVKALKLKASMVSSDVRALRAAGHVGPPRRGPGAAVTAKAAAHERAVVAERHAVQVNGVALRKAQAGRRPGGGPGGLGGDPGRAGRAEADPVGDRRPARARRARHHRVRGAIIGG